MDVKKNSEKSQASRLEKWERTRRFWYNFYLFAGVGVNFLIYFTKPYGFDPGVNVPLGAAVGLGIPLGTMFLGTYIHQKVLGI